jgi:hypothetical protein
MRRHSHWLVPAIALATGCASTSARPGAAAPPAAEPAETPQPGDPVVTLLDPGAEPRAPLRFRMRPGKKEILIMEMQTSMKMSLNGTPVPTSDMPPIRMTMTINVPEVASDGRSRSVSRLIAVDVVARHDDRPELVATMKQGMAKLVGMTTEMWVTPRGFARDVKVELPPGLPPAMATTMQSMRNATEQIAAIFPFEPVGQGARWRLASAVDLGMFKLQQSAIVTLDRREANRAVLSMTVEQTAPPQPITGLALKQDSTTSLERYSGAGQVQLDAALDSRVPRGQAHMKTAMATAVEKDQHRMSVAVAAEMAMTISPGSGP